MIQCIKLCSLLLVGASALLAQNFTTHTPAQSCKVGDLSTAEGLEARATMQAAVASSTCPGPPPPPPSGGNWTYVQDGYSGGWPGGGICFVWSLSCTAFLKQPVTPGNLLIVLPLTYTGGVTSTLTSVNQENVQFCNVCEVPTSYYLQTGMAYVLSARGGETQITCNFSTPPSGWIGCGAVEAHWSGTGGVTFDAGGASIAACGLNCPGIKLNLNGSDDFILQVDFPYFTNPLSVSSPSGMSYTFFQGSYAYALDAANGAAPTWKLPQSDPATSNNAIAFTGR